MALDLIHRVCAVGHGAQVQPLQHHLVPGEGAYDRTATTAGECTQAAQRGHRGLAAARCLPRGCAPPLRAPAAPQNVLLRDAKSPGTSRAALCTLPLGTSGALLRVPLALQELPVPWTVCSGPGSSDLPEVRVQAGPVPEGRARDRRAQLAALRPHTGTAQADDAWTPTGMSISFGKTYFEKLSIFHGAKPDASDAQQGLDQRSEREGRVRGGAAPPASHAQVALAPVAEGARVTRGHSRLGPTPALASGLLGRRSPSAWWSLS